MGPGSLLCSYALWFVVIVRTVAEKFRIVGFDTTDGCAEKKRGYACRLLTLACKGKACEYEPIHALTTRLATRLLVLVSMYFSELLVKKLTIPALACIGAFTVSCSPTGGKTFDVSGVVRDIKEDGRTIVIRHRAIPGYMAAMTMPFRVRDTNEVVGVQSGDEVSFRLRVTRDESWVEKVRRTGKSTAQHLTSAPIGTATNRPKAFGLQSIPDFALTNEFGDQVRLRDFTGKAVAMTFFFTRCPLPEYCPRLSKNFRGAIDKLKAISGGPTNYHFLSVSFDPLDVPAALRAYGRTYGYDSNCWSFLTGDSGQIAELARGFGVAVTPGGGTIEHGFSTAIFDANGDLQNMWLIGGDMTDHIVGEILKAARPAADSP